MCLTSYDHKMKTHASEVIGLGKRELLCMEKGQARYADMMMMMMKGVDADMEENGEVDGRRRKMMK